MNSFDKIRKQRVVIRFLLSYMLILLIPLLIASFTYKGLVDILESNAIEANQTTLEQAKSVLDSRFKEINNIISHVGINSRIKTLLYSKAPIEKIIWDVKEAQEYLSPYIITNSYIFNFIMYFKNSNIILSPYTSYIRLDIFYDKLFQYGELSNPDFYDTLLNRYHSRKVFPMERVYFNGKEKKVITYVNSIPAGFPDNFQANMLFFIDADQIEAMLSRSRTEDGGWTCILDSEHQVIINTGDDHCAVDPATIEFKDNKGSFYIKSGNSKLILSYTISEYNDWTYITTLPYEIVMKSVNNIKRISRVMTLIFIVIGMLVAYLMASRNSKLLNELVKISSEWAGSTHYSGGNEIDFLQCSIAELVKNNKDMKNDSEQQIPLIREASLERLLRGELMDEEAINMVAEQIGLDLSSKYFNVIILRVKGYRGLVSKEIIKELALKKIIIKEVITRRIPENVFPHDIGVNEIALIVGLGLSGINDCEFYLENMMNELSVILHEKYKIQIYFGAGSICEKPIDIPRSFYEAIEVLENDFACIENRLIWYEQIDKNSSVYKYPLDMELQLMNFSKAGDSKSILRFLDEIQKENFEKRKLSAEMIWQLFYEMRGTLIKVIYKSSLKDDDSIKLLLDRMDHSLRGGDPEEVSSVIEDLYLQICNRINDQKKSHNTDLKEEMLEYLDLHFMDSNLCLSMMSMHFDLTEVYTSHFFKEQTGENFSIYLERLRINQAHKFLTDTTLTIEDIAGRTGYNSSHAFRRAYKRVNGIVPTAVRR